MLMMPVIFLHSSWNPGLKVCHYFQRAFDVQMQGLSGRWRCSAVLAAVLQRWSAGNERYGTASAVGPTNLDNMPLSKSQVIPVQLSIRAWI